MFNGFYELSEIDLTLFDNLTIALIQIHSLVSLKLCQKLAYFSNFFCKFWQFIRTAKICSKPSCGNEQAINSDFILRAS